MRKLFLGAALLATLAGAAEAQTVPTPTVPSSLSGFGTLSVLAASLAVSTLTLGPNSAVYPTGGLPNRYMTIRNSPASANTVFVCALGGTCTTANGSPIAVGGSTTWNIPSANGIFPSVTVISAGTATIVVEW